MSLSAIGIEIATARHLASIPGIELATAAMFREADLPLGIRYRVTDESILRRAQSESRLWVALSAEKEPIGFAMAAVLDGTAHLDELNVLPDYTRQGIGTRLARTVIDWARAGQFASLTLITFRHLPWNAPFYKKFGFVSVNEGESGDGIATLLKEECEAGINIENRTIMKLNLNVG